MSKNNIEDQDTVWMFKSTIQGRVQQAFKEFCYQQQFLLMNEFNENYLPKILDDIEDVSQRRVKIAFKQSREKREKREQVKKE